MISIKRTTQLPHTNTHRGMAHRNQTPKRWKPINFDSILIPKRWNHINYMLPLQQQPAAVRPPSTSSYRFVVNRVEWCVTNICAQQNVKPFADLLFFFLFRYSATDKHHRLLMNISIGFNFDSHFSFADRKYNKYVTSSLAGHSTLTTFITDTQWGRQCSCVV